MHPPHSPGYQQRFGGTARLYGEQSLAALAGAHFVVVGLGGVGGWAAEALARSGLGHLTLIDLDDVCISNTNRQIQALNAQIGHSKVATLAGRLAEINPDLKVHAVHDFITRKNFAAHIGPQHHVVIDAIDAAHIKATLVAYCRAQKIRLIVCGSSGGKRDPRQIQVADLGHTQSDPMLAKVRRLLYRHHNFARDKQRKFRIDAVYSAEQMRYPQPDGSVCMTKPSLQGGVKLDCASGFGASVMVTGSFGFLAAACAIERYLAQARVMDNGDRPPMFSV